MTKKDIVRELAGELGISLADAKKAVDLTIDYICRIICEQARLELRNFGVFEVRTRAARKARNPRTNTPVNVPPRRVVTFQPGKFLAAAVANHSQVTVEE
jgi:nucleoid DNA-binding protein